MENEKLASVHCFACAKNRMRFGLKDKCPKCKLPVNKPDAKHLLDALKYDTLKYSSTKIIKKETP